MKPTKALYAVRLPTYIVNWLRAGARDISGASLITIALKAHYKIPTPEERATKAASATKSTAQAKVKTTPLMDFPAWFQEIYNSPLYMAGDEHIEEYERWKAKQ